MDNAMQTDGQNVNVNDQQGNSPPQWLQAFQQQMIQSFNDQMNQMAQQMTQRIDAIDQRTQQPAAPPPPPAVALPTVPIPADQTTTTSGPTEPIPTPPSDHSDVPTQPKRPKHTLKELSTFTGKRSEWPAWKDEAIGKLTTDAAAIGGPMEQFSYLRSCVGGNAARTILTFVQSKRATGTGTPQDLLVYMEDIYGDTNSEERANNRLNSMTQGREAFATFLPKFERTLAEAGGGEWADQVKINTLKRMLNQELRRSLVYIPVHPTAYNDFTRTLSTLASRLQALNPRSSTMTPTSSTTNCDTMDWEPSANKTQISTPNDGQKRAQWVSKDMLEKRKSNSLCLRCGGKGHFISSCKLLPAKPPQQNQTKARVTKVMDDVEEDDGIDDATVIEELGPDTESGKE